MARPTEFRVSVVQCVLQVFDPHAVSLAETIGRRRASRRDSRLGSRAPHS